MATSTRRYRLTVQYDGRTFHGWQVQPALRTVQGEIETVLARLFDRPARVIGSGRTDRGVHAKGQVVAVDAPSRWTGHSLARALNALLPADVWIEACAAAPDDFHPRYDAVSRTYHYYVGTAHRAASPFHRGWCWPVREALDLDAIRLVTPRLIGDHSFRSFAKAGQEERGDRCAVTAAGWTRWDDLGWRFEISANRFLHHMVRYLVGTLVAIGRGERPPDELPKMLSAGGELTTSPPAPAGGLFLVRVEYPEDRENP